MMPALQQHWQNLSAQFAARVPRERMLMAAGGVAVVVMLFDLVALSPLAAESKRVAAQLAEARTAIKAGDAIIAATSAQANPDDVKRRYREELRKQIAEIDAKLLSLQSRLVPPEQVGKLLEGVLARDRGLALVSLRKLPVQRIQTPGAAATPDGKPANPPGERSIYQHSFELSVEGSYADLHNYLARLEKLPWQLFWGKVTLDAGGYPRLRLTLTVHTLSLNKAWLVV